MTDKALDDNNDAGSTKTLAIITWVLYLLGLGLLGLIIAYVKRSDARGTAFESHFTYAIRTFWIGLIGIVIGGATALLVIGNFILVAVAIWFLVRTIIGLVKALDNKPIANSKTWLV